MSKRLLNQSFESPLALSLQMEAASQALAAATDARPWTYAPPMMSPYLEAELR